jgi:hypothetical protein
MRTVRACALALLCAATLTGCTSTPPPTTTTTPSPPPPPPPPRPTTPPPPFHLFHQSPDTLTLTTSPTATDSEIEAILYQLRDAAHNHTFDTLHLPQKLIDARAPMMWFHLYRGTQCAAEKYAPGAPPCGPSYHAAGDYTLGGTHNPNWDSGVLLTPSSTDELHQTQLWLPGSPYTP